jgi:glycosyltransferase involved in cell wall biosynthesis
VKVLHVSSSFYPATFYGGPIYSTYALCNALASQPDVEVRVLTTDTAGPRFEDRVDVRSFPLKVAAGYPVYYCKKLFGDDIAPGLFARLWKMILWADVVHLTGAYSPPTIPTLLITRILGTPLVWSPRGGFQEWQSKTRRKTKLFWNRICNALCAEDRVVLHLTSEAEKLESHSVISNARIAVIPNGIELPPTNGEARTDSETLRLLYLGRLHPIKGIENLLRAVKHSDASVALSICGDGDIEYRHSLEALSSELGLSDRVEFQGHVVGEAKSRAFINADACVAPSFKENFCVVVAEALAHGVPVIASKGTPWRSLEEHDCGFWVDNSEEELTKAIKKMGQSSREVMGARGREWMAQEFCWDALAKRMHKVYEGLCRRKH